MGNVDIRIFAAILALIGIVAGWFLNASVLLIITIALVITAMIVFRYLVPPSQRTGASGEMGAFMVVVGAVTSLVFPSWIVYLVRLISR